MLPLALEYTQTAGSLHVRFKPCARKAGVFREELFLAAKTLHGASGGRPIVVGFSGGFDSELVCRAFLEQGIPFRALTLSHKDGANHHDTDWARAWCVKHNVAQEIHTVDMEWLLGEYLSARMGEGLAVPCPFRYFQCYILDVIAGMGGFGILGGGEQLYNLGAGGEAGLEFDTGFFAALERHQNHCPYFFMSSSELVASYMKNPIVAATLKFPSVFGHPDNAFLLKRLVYQMEFPDLAGRKKFTGWENIPLPTMLAQRKLKEHFKDKIHASFVGAREMANQLGLE